MQKALLCEPTKDNDVNESKNVALFSVITSKLSSAEKLKQFTQFLKEGADILSLDKNDKNNTLLHVAAINGEVEIVKLLLNKNADATIINDDNETVLDIIQQQDTPKSQELAAILYKKYGYQKRPGTSGVRGELYETKLLSLILFRALYDENITEFILGTNLDDIGALDDIILRYNPKHSQQAKMLFLQAKHRENEIMTVDDLLNPKKDTNLHKYFESYVRVRHKFITDNDNTMFQGMMKNLDCEFIIYTSAKQYNSKNQKTDKNITLKEIQEGENLIKASKTGKVLQFKYANELNDFTDFVSIASKTRAIVLAQSLIKFIVKDNSKYKNMMLDNLIKEYHIYLVQNIVEAKAETSNDIASNSSKVSNHLKGQFHSSFLTSDNENLRIIRTEIHKELAEIKGLSPNSNQVELNNIMKSLTFKLPTDFGNHHFSFGGNKTKQQNKLTHLCSIFEKIFPSTGVQNSTYIYVHLDDDSVGPDELVQSKDLGNYWLGGLVGNLLIHDDETEMLKFNLYEQSLSEDNIKILEKLKVNRDLTLFRFNINFLNFPKLALNSKPCREYDRKLVKHFLENLRIYTNQAKEDEVEKVLKDEIYTHYNNRKKQPDLLFHIKCDAIFLTVHDNIQKWWKQPNSAPYLTEKCKFYEAVEREILDSPVLSVVHFICCKNITNSLLEFEEEAMNSIKIKEFLNSKETIAIIISDDVNFSSVKVVKYLNEIKKRSDYKLINLDHEIVEICYDIILNELENSIPLTSTLVVVSQGNTDVDNWRLCNMTNIFKGKIIIITNNSISDSLKIKCLEQFINRDTTNNFSNLSYSVRKMISEEREITFQGLPNIVKKVLGNDALNLFSPDLLRKIINKDKIAIGNKLDILHETLGDPNGMNTNFIKRKISRMIAINTKKDYFSKLIFKEDIDKDCLLENNKDVVVISDLEDTFKQTCKIHNETNIHWFTRMNKKDEIIWNKSHGTLKNLIKYIHRSLSLPVGYQYTTKLKNLDYKITLLNETQDRTVILNAEPGMGKSTLLTYLAINTKQMYPDLWILRINLLDSQFLNQLNDWNENNLNIDIVHVMKFLYSAINHKYFTNNDICTKISNLITVNNINEVHISVSDDKNLPEIDLSEIKLLNYFYNHNKLVVLLDGFDEICPDYTCEVVQLLNVLKTSKVAHLWITSRPYNGLEKLELALETFSFTLDPLNMREQMQYLQNVWSKKFCQDKSLPIRKKIYTCICEVYTVIINALDDDTKFTSIPLHLYMISEIYENLLRQHIEYRLTDSFPQDCMLDLNLNYITLYEKFTKKKFHMQFEEKNNSMNSKDPYIKKLKQDAYKLFIKNHKNIAAYLLLDRSIVLSEYDIESIQDFMMDLKSDSEKTGIIKSIDSNPKFVHYTFAEYFAVEFLLDKLISGKLTKLLWQYVIETILLISDKQGIRRFINSKLQKGQHIVTSLKSKEEQMIIVFDILLTQFRSLLSSALFVAIEENFEHIAVFLIECIKAPVNKGNLHTFINILHKKCNKFCVICMALTKRNESVIKHLIELFTEIDLNRDLLLLYSEDDQRCVSLNALLYLDQLTVHTVEQFLTKNNKGWIPTYTAHYVLGRHGFLVMLCYDYITRFNTDQRLQLFNDKAFKSPPENIHYTWVTAVSIGREKFIKMCTTLDVSTLKSIMLMLKRILIKVYEKSDANVEEFIFKTIPKLESEFAQSKKRFDITKSKSYESQLLNLVLLRLLFDDQIKEFTITSFIRGIDLFNDVVLRYKSDNLSLSKMIFLQIQNVIDDDLLTLNMKNKLLRYFQSYLLIREKFRTDNGTTLFQETMKDLDCKFIIYTTSKNTFSKKTFFQASEENTLIKTNDNLKIFQYQYTKQDIETLVTRLCNSRAVELGKYISTHVFDPFGSMMKQDLMKIYHVFIAEKIIKIESFPDEKHNFCICRFRSTFLKSDDENLRLVRHEIFKKYLKEKGLNLNEQFDMENIMKTLKFVLPPNFGEYSFCFNGNETEQQEKLDGLLSVFLKLCNKHQHDDSEYTVFEFDDSSNTSDDNFQIKDLLENSSLAGLVGNLLIFDELTGALKINFNEENLSRDSIKVLEGLKQNFLIHQLGKFRFDINIHGFPKLSLNNTEYERKLATDFLNNLRFYTNQASEDGVEDVLKQELNKHFYILKKQNDFLFRVKCDAIFFSYLSMQEENNSWRSMYSTEYYKHKRPV